MIRRIRIMLRLYPNPLSAQAGLRSQKILAACYQSAKNGSAIDIQ